MIIASSDIGPAPGHAHTKLGYNDTLRMNMGPGLWELGTVCLSCTHLHASFIYVDPASHVKAGVHCPDCHLR